MIRMDGDPIPLVCGTANGSDLLPLLVVAVIFFSVYLIRKRLSKGRKMIKNVKNLVIIVALVVAVAAAVAIKQIQRAQKMGSTPPPVVATRTLPRLVDLGADKCIPCKMMMPILEDNTLAERSGAGFLSIYDVLQYSSVCGTGLDTVPLAGDVEEEKLEALLLDVAALAVRLNKSLTARLMPIPGKKAGDAIEFNFPYFAKGKVLDYPYSGISRPLIAGKNIPIKPRG